MKIIYSMAKKYTVLLKRSNETLSEGEGKIPQPIDLEYGEIALNYHEGTEGLFIKNDSDEIVTFGPREDIWEKGSGENSVQQKGTGAVAGGDNSVAEGHETIASGLDSHAENGGTSILYHQGKDDERTIDTQQTQASGEKSHAEGIGTNASGQGAHAEGSIAVTDDSNWKETGEQTIIYTEASGRGAHAEGLGTKSEGSGSHSEGIGAIAAGNSSHSEGYYTKVEKGEGAHSEGFQTKVNGNGAHAEGYSTYSVGTAAHSEGRGGSATGYGSHKEGGYEHESEVLVTLRRIDRESARYILVQNAGDLCHLNIGASTVDFDKIIYIENIEAEDGISTYLNLSDYIPNDTEGDEFVNVKCRFSNSAKGASSHSEGVETVAQGVGSHAEGGYTRAEGRYSHAEGIGYKIIVTGQPISDTIKAAATETRLYQTTEGTSAADVYSVGCMLYKLNGVDVSDRGITVTAVYTGGSKWFQLSEKLGIGNKKTANVEFIISQVNYYSSNSGSKGYASHSEGIGTTALGSASHAEGNTTNATGDDSHAEGYNTTASGYHSHAEGSSTTASGYNSHAEGNTTNATGDDSHAEGYNTTASGYHSHAEGDHTTASGTTSHAEGENTTASGYHSHAEGFNTTASGTTSHAEGENTTASGYNSHTEGYNTTAQNETEHAEGIYNISNKHSDIYGSSGNTQHSVGIGRDDANRKNAFEIMQNGDAYLYGIGDYEGNNLKTDETKPSKTVQEVIKSLENDSLWESGSGENSVQQKGSGAVASGVSSVAEGSGTTASGIASHAEGQSTEASGTASHAEGYTNTVESNYAHIEGALNYLGSDTTKVPPSSDGSLYNTKSTGSHVEGQGNVIIEAPYSHVEGCRNKISKNGIVVKGVHVEGKQNVASGNYSHVEGLSNEVLEEEGHAEGYQVKVQAMQGHAEGWYTLVKGRAGHAEGYNTQAVAFYSHAEGQGSMSLNQAAHAEGENTQATGQDSHTEGFNTKTGGNDSQNTLSGGTYTKVGAYAHAEGNATLAQAIASHTEGEKTFATGRASHAEGNATTASGSGSHAEGEHATASGSGSHAEGDHTTASGVSSHAEGSYTTASNTCSHAEGDETKAFGYCSHAEGVGTTASGYGSHAEGVGTTASGYGSHAEGEHATAQNEAEHAEGRYNKSNKSSNTYGDSGNTQHSIGIGASTADTKNAFEIMQNGDTYLYGVGGYDGTNATASTSNTLQNVVSGKQDTLVSGTNIKTVNGVSILGSGNLDTGNVFEAGTGEHSAVLRRSNSIASGEFAVAEGSGEISTIESQITELTDNEKQAIQQHYGRSFEYYFWGDWNSPRDGSMVYLNSDHEHPIAVITDAVFCDSEVQVDETYIFGVLFNASGATLSTGVEYYTESMDTDSANYAAGNYSHAEGLSVKALGWYSHAEGQDTTASGTTSHAEGYCAIASGNFSHAEGNNTRASAYTSHAEGNGAIASGENSHAEGVATIASGNFSHAEGNITRASGYTSHAEGDRTKASATCSHAEGYRTTANGGYSHAEGANTTTRNLFEHAEGYFNKSNTFSLDYGHSGNTQHSIGIGTSTADTKNAFEIMQNGNAYLYGVGGYNGTNPSSNNSLQKIFADISEIRSLSLSELDYILGTEGDASGGYIAALYIDDFEDGQGGNTYAEESGYNNIQEYISDVCNNMSAADHVGTNIFMPTCNVMEYEGAEYRVWVGFNAGENRNSIYALAPKNLDYTTLYNNSMEANVNNHYCPFAVVFNGSPDEMGDIYTDNLDVDYRLICVKTLEYSSTPIQEHSSAIAKIYFDDFHEYGLYMSMHNAGVDTMDNYIQAVRDNDNPDQYWEDVGVTVEYEGVEYKFYADGSSNMYGGLLPMDMTYQDLYPHTLECDGHNINTPYSPFVVRWIEGEGVGDYEGEDPSNKYSTIIAIE